MHRGKLKGQLQERKQNTSANSDKAVNLLNRNEDLRMFKEGERMLYRREHQLRADNKRTKTTQN